MPNNHIPAYARVELEKKGKTLVPTIELTRDQFEEIAEKMSYCENAKIRILEDPCNGLPIFEVRDGLLDIVLYSERMAQTEVEA